jgi:hypothetical protein
MQPACAAPEGIGKCSATLYQAAGTLLGATFGENDPFNARFRIRDNPDTANCQTGHLLLGGVFSPPTSTCRNGAVVGVAGVALGDLGF